MKVLSLFSGIGGFDLAAQKAGHEIIGACEIDNHARSIYEKHFPNVKMYNDATKINPHNLPDFDLLVAGFPCQAFSPAGKELGFEDTRGTLFFEIARIAREKRPRYLLLENVRGLLFNKGGKTSRKIIKTLDELGYDIQGTIINSENFVPQNRERIFIIGYLRDECRREILPFPKPGTKSNERKTTKLTARCLQAPGHSAGNYRGMTMIYVSQTNANMKNRIQNRDKSWCLTHACSDFVIVEAGRVRRLTPLECERLQGLPDNWTKGLSDTQRYKCISNAVTEPVIEYLLSLIN